LEAHSSLIPQTIDILDDIAYEDGWAHISAQGRNITKFRPDFDPRAHGYKKLSELIKWQSQAFEIQARNAAGGTRSASE